MRVTYGASRRVRRLTGHEIACYDVLSRELARRVVLVRLPWLPGPFAGMTLGRFILLSRDVPTDGASPLLAHELVHVRQWAEIGVIGFTAAYLGQFGRSLLRTRNWHRSYRDIGAEREARKQAERWGRRRSEDPAPGTGPSAGRR